MKASVVKLNFYFPIGQMRTDNDIVVSFRPPADGSISLLDELEIDLVRLDMEQEVANLTTGKMIRLRIEKQNVYDTRLPGGHGVSRFPSLARRRGD
jgi:hypothetical protein